MRKLTYWFAKDPSDIIVRTYSTDNLGLDTVELTLYQDSFSQFVLLKLCQSEISLRQKQVHERRVFQEELGLYAKGYALESIITESCQSRQPEE